MDGGWKSSHAIVYTDIWGVWRFYCHFVSPKWDSIFSNLHIFFLSLCLPFHQHRYKPVSVIRYKKECHSTIHAMRTETTIVQITITIQAAASTWTVRLPQDWVSYLWVYYFWLQIYCSFCHNGVSMGRDKNNKNSAAWPSIFNWFFLCSLIAIINGICSESRSTSYTMCSHATLNTNQSRFVCDECEQRSTSTFVCAKRLSCKRFC